MSALLEAHDIAVDFGAHAALAGASISVSAGEIVGLIGPNGAGKTTFLDVIAGDESPSRGRVELAGQDVTSLPSWRRARLGLARTFQAADLVDAMTVRENLMVGCQARQRTSLVEDALRVGRSRRAELLAAREVEHVLELTGVEADAERTVASLPLGRRRLVEIARALCTLPRVLLLDEAGSGMSAEDLDALSALLRRLTARDGLAVVLVEHDVEFVIAVCDFVYVLAGGRVIARGHPAAVRRDPRVIHAYTGEVHDGQLAAAG